MVAQRCQDKEFEIIDMLESGEVLLFVSPLKEKFIAQRAELNNKEATILDCQDGSIIDMNISWELLDTFSKVRIYEFSN